MEYFLGKFSISRLNMIVALTVCSYLFAHAVIWSLGGTFKEGYEKGLAQELARHSAIEKEWHLLNGEKEKLIADCVDGLQNRFGSRP